MGSFNLELKVPATRWRNAKEENQGYVQPHTFAQLSGPQANQGSKATGRNCTR